MERLQKVIAQAGICSRRKAEQLILDGKVRVNGKIVETLGTQVSGSDTIEVAGKPISRQEYVYYLLNKPKGCITTSSDDKGRPTVMDYIDESVRVFPVGRLDWDTSGALILTNDGQFTNLMTHPRHEIPKTYRINLQGMLTDEDLTKIRKGFKGEGMKFAPAKVAIVSKDYPRDRMIVDLTLHEGQNHEVKNMMSALGHQVRRLHRVKFGDLSADDLKPGEYRRIKPHEITKLKELARKEV